MAKTKMGATERKIYYFLKMDFDTKELGQRSRFTEKQIAKALDMDLPKVKQTVRSLWTKNGHIHKYRGPRYRYRSKTRQHIYKMCRALVEAKWGITGDSPCSSSWDGDPLVK